MQIDCPRRSPPEAGLLATRVWVFMGSDARNRDSAPDAVGYREFLLSRGMRSTRVADTEERKSPFRNENWED